MSSNYEWQRHQTNELIQTRLNESQSHRMAKQGKARGEFFLVKALRWLFGGGRTRMPVDQKVNLPETGKKKRFAN